jgi:hypothetical protein
MFARFVRSANRGKTLDRDSSAAGTANCFCRRSLRYGVDLTEIRLRMIVFDRF